MSHKDEDILEEGETTAIVEAGLVLSASFGPSGVWLNSAAPNYEELRTFIAELRARKSGVTS